MQSLTQRQQKLESWLSSQALTPDEPLLAVSGDASFRRYFRYLHKGRWYIAVDAPPPQESVAEFVAVARAYEQAGLRVPHVHACDENEGFIILDDLGDELLFARLKDDSNAQRYYQHALDLLPAVMRTERTALGPLPEYSTELLERELNLFSDWLIERYLGITLSESEHQTWLTASALFVDNARSQPQVGVHRDYHSRNIMLSEGDSLALIDFQDAVTGPVTYDAVSLLRDCYAKWPAELVKDLSGHLYHRLQTEGLIESAVTADQWQRWFDWMGIQRHCKAAGIFARLFLRDGKAGYRADIPRTVSYLVEVSAQYAELQDFNALLSRRIQPAVLACAQ